MAATRIMPIERLFPGAVSKRSPPIPTLVSAAPTRFRTLKRICVHVLLATLTVLAVAAWKLPRAPARARLMPLLQPSELVPEEKASADPEAEPELGQAAPLPPAAHAHGAAKTKAQPREPLERRAIELVIAGDFSGAEQAYRALAVEREDTTSAAVFREAARILADRAHLSEKK